jgi:hypothetical protein
LKRRNPEVRISNRIVGRHIVVGCIKRHSRHEHEFARDRSIGLWYRSAPGISQCRQLALCWMDEEQIRGGIQPRNGRPVYGLHKYAARGIEPRLCICVVRAVASRSAIPQVPPFAGVGVRGLSSSNIARQRSLKALSGLLAAWLYPHLSGCPPLTTSNSRERSAWTAATASVILRT